MPPRWGYTGAGRPCYLGRRSRLQRAPLALVALPSGTNFAGTVRLPQVRHRQQPCGRTATLGRPGSYAVTSFGFLRYCNLIK